MDKVFQVLWTCAVIMSVTAGLVVGGLYWLSGQAPGIPLAKPLPVQPVQPVQPVMPPLPQKCCPGCKCGQPVAGDEEPATEGDKQTRADQPCGCDNPRCPKSGCEFKNCRCKVSSVGG